MQSKKDKKILIAAGGTGGHLFPAQDLAKSLRQKGAKITFAGFALKKNPFFQKLYRLSNGIRCQPAEAQLDCQCRSIIRR